MSNTPTKRRGRPPGTKNKTVSVSAAPRRGRPPGTKNGPAKAAAPVLVPVVSTKRRGRPPGTKNKSVKEVVPPPAPVTSTKRRGRPPGTKANRPAAAQPPAPAPEPKRRGGRPPGNTPANKAKQDSKTPPEYVMACKFPDVLERLRHAMGGREMKINVCGYTCTSSLESSEPDCSVWVYEGETIKVIRDGVVRSGMAHSAAREGDLIMYQDSVDKVECAVKILGNPMLFTQAWGWVTPGEKKR